MLCVLGNTILSHAISSHTGSSRQNLNVSVDDNIHDANDSHLTQVTNVCFEKTMETKKTQT